MSESIITKEEKTVIALMLLGVFIASLNQTILAPALPSIMRTMDITASQGQWFTTIFLLVNGIMVPITAYLTERFPSRGLYLTSIGLFTLGTAAAAFSSVFWQLLVARILQGLAFGILMPLMINTMMAIFPVHRRGTAMGYAGIVFAGAPAIGPPIAGYIIDHWGWNMTFMSLLPLLVLDFIFSAIFLKNIGKTRPASLDWPSVFLSTVGFGGMLFGFSVAGTRGWFHPLTYGTLIIGLLFLIVFVRRQKRIETPLLRMSIFRFRQFNVGTAIGMCVNAALIAGAIATPIYLQQVLGYSALKATIVFLLSAVFGIISSPFVGALFDRHGLRKLAIAGIGSTLLGTLFFLTFDEQSPFWYLILIYTLRNTGIFLVMGPVNTWSLNILSGPLIPHGNAAATTLRQVAGSLGTAIIITIMTMVTLQNSELGFNAATLHGFHVAFAVSAAIIAFALVLVLVYVRGHCELDSCDDGINES